MTQVQAEQLWGLFCTLSPALGYRDSPGPRDDLCKSPLSVCSQTSDSLAGPGPKLPLPLGLPPRISGGIDPPIPDFDEVPVGGAAGPPTPHGLRDTSGTPPVYPTRAKPEAASPHGSHTVPLESSPPQPLVLPPRTTQYGPVVPSDGYAPPRPVLPPTRFAATPPRDTPPLDPYAYASPGRVRSPIQPDESLIVDAPAGATDAPGAAPPPPGPDMPYNGHAETPARPASRSGTPTLTTSVYDGPAVAGPAQTVPRTNTAAGLQRLQACAPMKANLRPPVLGSAPPANHCIYGSPPAKRVPAQHGASGRL